MRVVGHVKEDGLGVPFAGVAPDTRPLGVEARPLRFASCARSRAILLTRSSLGGYDGRESPRSYRL